MPGCAQSCSAFGMGALGPLIIILRLPQPPQQFIQTEPFPGQHLPHHPVRLRSRDPGHLSPQACCRLNRKSPTSRHRATCDNRGTPGPPDDRSSLHRGYASPGPMETPKRWGGPSSCGEEQFAMRPCSSVFDTRLERVPVPFRLLARVRHDAETPIAC